MRVIFIASGDFAIPTLHALVDSGHEICFVVTQPDRPAGRGKQPAPTPVRSAANALGLPVHAVEDINDAAMIERARRGGARVGVVVAFGQKIKPDFRAALPGGCINLHASLLPKYRGAAPYQWAIIQGEPTTGVTVFRLVDRMDAGPVLTTAETEIGETETAAELHDRLAIIGPDAVLRALDMYADDDIPAGTPQDDAQATRAPKFQKHDGWIAFDRPAHAIARRINGLWSWPGAVCRFESADGRRKERVTLARAVARDAPVAGPPGTLNDARHVVTADGAVEIIEIKPEGGKRMEWRAFVNGRHVAPGDRFTSVSE